MLLHETRGVLEAFPEGLRPGRAEVKEQGAEAPDNTRHLKTARLPLRQIKRVNLLKEFTTSSGSPFPLRPLGQKRAGARCMVCRA